jgi:hypothetical protein
MISLRHAPRSLGRWPGFAAGAAAALALGVGISAEQNAAIDGHARDEAGAPVPFALVRLVRADSSPMPADSPLQGITDADGRYRFDRVPPGRYRVEVQRLGFQPWLSDAVAVASNGSVKLDLRVASQPLVVPAATVTVTADACVPASQLKAHPRILTIWQQARDGASVRTGLMARFRYNVHIHEESYELKADGPGPAGTLDRSHVSDPRSAARNAARIRELRLSRGYYAPNDGFHVPSELDVLHEDFLKTHCLVVAAAQGPGEVGVHFRVLRPRRNFLDVVGTIWLDSATYLPRRIELEYMDLDESRGTVRVDFADVPVGRGTLRMPAVGTFTMRPSRTNPTRRTQGTWTIAYSGFEEVARRADRTSAATVSPSTRPTAR